jgi:hypothetical protein
MLVVLVLVLVVERREAGGGREENSSRSEGVVRMRQESRHHFCEQGFMRSEKEKKIKKNKKNPKGCVSKERRTCPRARARERGFRREGAWRLSVFSPFA